MYSKIISNQGFKLQSNPSMKKISASEFSCESLGVVGPIRSSWRQTESDTEEAEDIETQSGRKFSPRNARSNDIEERKEEGGKWEI